MSDIMLDIETLGLKAGAIPVSVGACCFDRATGEITKEFYRVIDPITAASAGLHVEIGTTLWWMDQSDDARAVFKDICEPLADVAAAFFNWVWDRAMADVTIWAQGDMDFQVWGAAMDAVKVDRPWAFWQQRDTRTVYDVCGFDAKAFPRNGTHHNALDDARHQVACLHAALKSKGLAQ